MYPHIPALSQALAAALIAYPADCDVILRGYNMALQGRVTLGAEGIHQVESDSHPGEYYTVNGACTCRAYPKAPEGRCKHRWAVALLKRAETLAMPVRPPRSSRTGYGPWPADMGGANGRPAPSTSLAAEVCNPDHRVARELAGFSGPTARHI